MLVLEKPGAALSATALLSCRFYDFKVCAVIFEDLVNKSYLNLILSLFDDIQSSMSLTQARI